jgi:hypothetical protein
MEREIVDRDFRFGRASGWNGRANENRPGGKDKDKTLRGKIHVVCSLDHPRL